MNNDYIIILLLIIIILILAIGIVLFGDFSKNDCEILILSNDTLNQGDNFTIKLVDINNNPISNENIAVKLMLGNNVKSEYTVKTDSQGKASLILNNITNGTYTANITFNGNSEFKAVNVAKQIIIGEVTTSSSSSSESSSESSASSSSSTNSIDANRPVNDENYKGYNPYHESEVTASGWNPREHEVSRESIGGGNERIKYDDGYMRIVDSNGYVITYGYGG